MIGVNTGNPEETSQEQIVVPARVLVVDDEEDIRNLVAFNLRAAGIDVLLARTGSEAIHCARTERN